MPPKIVKICVEELHVTLIEIVNYAFNKNRFPDDLKRAEISLIFKKNDDMLSFYPFSPKYLKQ